MEEQCPDDDGESKRINGCRSRLQTTMASQRISEPRSAVVILMTDRSDRMPKVAYTIPRKSAPPPITGLKSKKAIAFGWYGGKYSHLDWLLPLLPPCHHYCEPFAGSAAVLLNREPSPVETYNDIDGEVANFFRVLRDQKDRLVEAIALTPFSREEFYLALTDDG